MVYISNCHLINPSLVQTDEYAESEQVIAEISAFNRWYKRYVLMRHPKQQLACLGICGWNGTSQKNSPVLLAYIASSCGVPVSIMAGASVCKGTRFMRQFMTFPYASNSGMFSQFENSHNFTWVLQSLIKESKWLGKGPTVGAPIFLLGRAL